MENASTPLVFLFVHGLGGKTLWMHPFVMSLAAALEMQNLPAAFYGLELLAYGGAHPTGQAHFDDRRHLMQTVVAALDHLRARHPEALLVPVGLSLGALVLTHAMALLWKTNQITTLGPLQFCLVSPAFRAARASFGPEIYAQVIRGYALSLMGKPLTAPPIPLPYAENQVLVTRNQAMAEYMHADTRRVTHMSALGYLELLKLTVLDTFRALPRIHSPVLQFMPGCDAVCDSLWMIRGFERIASDEKQLVLFPEAYHDLTVEPEMPLMAAYLAQWASAAIETPPVAPLPLPGQPLPV
jgi:alpha-beta hydrolase superfamily lysophospholipase